MTEVTRGYDGPPLQWEYDAGRDVITIEGQAYTGQLFREWAKGGMASGSLFEFVRSPGGAIAINLVWPKKAPA